MPNWLEVLGEIQQLELQAQVQSNNKTAMVRLNHVVKLAEYTKRNVIAYYSGYMSKPSIEGLEINDEDKNGFMMAIHKLDRNLGLDLILHTPGGDVAATHSIVDYLRQMFHDDIRAIIPQQAMSAGTMLACSCKQIFMARHSNMGPIDPHLRGIPAYGVIKEFERACDDVKKDAAMIPIWQSIIGQYHPSFLTQCENVIEWSNAFVVEQLSNVMFSGDDDAKSKAEGIVSELSKKNHDRHIHFAECQRIGLKVGLIEDEPALQDLVLTVHHCYMHTLMNSPVYKIIENNLGAGLMKNAPA